MRRKALYNYDTLANVVSLTSHTKLICHPMYLKLQVLADNQTLNVSNFFQRHGNLKKNILGVEFASRPNLGDGKIISISAQ